MGQTDNKLSEWVLQHFLTLFMDLEIWISRSFNVSQITFFFQPFKNMKTFLVGSKTMQGHSAIFLGLWAQLYWENICRKLAMRKKCSYPLEPSRLCKGQDNLRKENQTDRLWQIVTIALGRIRSSAMIPQPWGNCFRLCKSRGASLSRWPLSRLLWMSRSWAECENKGKRQEEATPREFCNVWGMYSKN